MYTERVINEAKYIIDTNSTIRETAKQFGVSKSTVHIDMSRRLLKINPKIYDKIKVIMDEHWNNKHILGGLSTYNKYKKNKNK